MKVSFIQDVSKERLTWPSPQSRTFAALSDCGLYAEVLQVARKESAISPGKLISSDQGLRQRMRRLHLVQEPTKTNVNALVRALEAFGWLTEIFPSPGTYGLTPEGEQAAQVSITKPKDFRRMLAAKLHERYVVPGWIVSRLHSLNPQGQGEVVLPAPPKSSGRADRRAWHDNEWPHEYDSVTVKAAQRANEVFPSSFPMPLDDWLFQVRSSWKRLGSGDPPGTRKRVGKIHGEKEATFGRRERLVHAMREVAVQFLFGIIDPVAMRWDFNSQKQPIPPRAFSVWCPRLEELEFIFYTDYHPLVPGRVIVPCASFRHYADSPPFEPLRDVVDPYERCLWLHQPQWEQIGEKFLAVLQDTYRRASKQIGAMYVSLLNIRDEVCRQLRLSSIHFDFLLEIAYRLTVRSGISAARSISISLESDIIADQLGAVGLNRRPVYIHNVPHSLIAIAALSRHR